MALQPKELSKTHPKLLLGEGREEEFFLTAIVGHLGLSNTIQVHYYGGKNNLRNFLKALPSRSDFDKLTSIGITRDADDNIDTAKQAVADAIQNANFRAELSVSMHIFPDNSQAGALEALCLDAARQTAVWSCVESFEKCLLEKGIEQLSPTNRDKRLLHVWLSSLKEPWLRLGEAAKGNHIPFKNPAFTPLCDFLRNL